MRARFFLEECKLLGRGAEGSVYLSPEGYALKNFRTQKAAQEEAKILNVVKESRFFPTVFVQVSNLIVREYVGGINLLQYISIHGLSYNLSIEIIEFVEDMKKYNFKRVNIRNAHIYIDEDEKLMVIDPRGSFSKITPFPKDIIKILLKTKSFDKFINYLTEYNPNLLSYWISGYDYVSKTNRVSRYG